MELKANNIFNYKTGLSPFQMEYSKFNMENKNKKFNYLAGKTTSSDIKPNLKRDLKIKRIKSSKPFEHSKMDELNSKYLHKNNDLQLKDPYLINKYNNNLNDINIQTNENQEINDNIIYKKEEKEKSIEDKNNNINNISIYSTQCINDEKIPRIQKQYYFLDNKAREKKRIELLKTSYHFNKFNNDRAIIRMINRFKNKEELELAQREYNKKYNQFSLTKRIPTKIAFGKGTSSNEVQEIDNNYNFNKRRKQQNIKKIKSSTKIKEIFKNGFNLKTENNLIINTKKNNLENKKEIFITNSNLETQTPRDCFGNVIYPVLAKHKILKNIMPNEVDYNTKTSIQDIVNSEIHPLLRFQKKIMSQSSNLISQELNVLFSKFISLSKLSPDNENLKRNDILIELKKDEKFIKLMRSLIGKDKEMEKILKDRINEEEKKRKQIRSRYLLKKIKEIILNGYRKIKKYNVDIEIFFSLMEINKNDEIFLKEYTNKGQYLFRVIKAGDVNEIIKVVNDNISLVSYKDEFGQIPLHICAKRNIYQIILFLFSRLSPIDAQDESGRTPLMIAAQYNYLEFVTILLFECADPKIKNVKNQMASDLTTNEKIKIILKRAEALHSLHFLISEKNFQNNVVNGLDFLYRKELDINYDKWISQGQKIVKDSRQSFL